MSARIAVEDLRQIRLKLRELFMQTDRRLLCLLDEPFLNYDLYDPMGRLLEFRTECRGVIVEIRPDLFDSYFDNVGPDDEVRMLRIFTPVSVDRNLAKISAACLAWAIEGKSEQAVSELL